MEYSWLQTRASKLHKGSAHLKRVSSDLCCRPFCCQIACNAKVINMVSGARKGVPRTVSLCALTIFRHRYMKLCQAPSSTLPGPGQPGSDRWQHSRVGDHDGRRA